MQDEEQRTSQHTDNPQKSLSIKITRSRENKLLLNKLCLLEHAISCVHSGLVCQDKKPNLPQLCCFLSILTCKNQIVNSHLIMTNLAKKPNS